MAVVNVTPANSSIDGFTPTSYTLLAADQYDIANDGRILVLVTGGAASSVITFVTGGTVGGLAVSDKTLTLPAGERRLVGPFPVSPYNNAQGKLRITSDTSDCTLIAIKV